MYKISLTLSLLLFALNTNFAQSTAPKSIIIAFNQKFPDATKVKWDKENSQEYEAEFEFKGEKYSANFSTDGDWLETESQMPFSGLPKKVQQTFIAEHQESKIKAVAQINNSQGKIKYEVEYKSGLKTKEVMYDEDGNKLNQ